MIHFIVSSRVYFLIMFEYSTKSETGSKSLGGEKKTF